MKIGITTTVIQRGKTGVAQYVFALTQALLAHAHEHEITLRSWTKNGVELSKISFGISSFYQASQRS
jgi:hypothetical protein